MPLFKSPWRNLQKKRHINSFLKIIAVVIIAFAVVNLTFKFSEFFSTLEKPLNSQDKKSNRQSLNFNYRTNLLLIGKEGQEIKQLVLASFETTAEKRLDLLIIPAEPFKGNPENLNQKVSSLIGLPLDGFIIFNAKIDLNEQTIKNFKNSLTLNNVLKLLDFYGYFNKNISTSLSLKDLGLVLVKLSSIRVDKIKEYEASAGDQNLIDSLVGKVFTEPTFLSEGARIEVKNGTGGSGLANLAARIITNLGGNVVSVSNAGSTVAETTLQTYFDRPKTTSRLSRIFNAKVIKEKISASGETRADLVLVIGQDFSARVLEEK